MADISIAEFKGIFTKGLVDIYAERPKVMGMLSSFFKKVESDTRDVSIEVQRGSEPVAVDVFRGTEGNRNSMDRSTEKIFSPAYYKEYFDATSLRHYKRTFGQASGIVSVTGASLDNMIEETAGKLGLLQDKIDRAYEKQASEVFVDGIVQLNSGTNIDFKRKAASKVDVGASNYWADAGVDPRTVLEAAGVFLRTKGKAQGGIFNVIMGNEAFSDFISNDAVKDAFDTRRIDVGFVGQPQMDSVGGVFHGTVSAGSYKYNIWTYPEGYENKNGDFIDYVDSKKIVVLPLIPNFTQAFAAVPQLVNQGGQEFFEDKMGAYHISNYVDQRREAHIFDMKSAGIMIPTAVDQLYTAQVVAS